MTSDPRPLVLLAHGTANTAGQEVVYAVGHLVAQRLPQVQTTVGFVDVCAPGPDVVLPGQPNAVIVPYLLTSGYHVRSDIPEAIAAYAPAATQTPALGLAGPVLDAAIDRHLEGVQASGTAVEAVVLAGAGSSDARARQEVLCMAALVSAALSLPVAAGFVSGAGPRACDALQTLRDRGAQRIAALSFLLAPGFFHGKVARLGADVTSAPLGVHHRLADLVVQRYQDAVGGCGGPDESVGPESLGPDESVGPGSGGSGLSFADGSLSGR